MRNGKPSESVQKTRQKEEVEMTKTMLMIVITFFVGWMPITVNCLAVLVTKNSRVFHEYSESFGLCFGMFTLVATYVNSALDPLIYAYRMKEVREDIKSLFKFKRNLSEDNMSLECVSKVNQTIIHPTHVQLVTV